MKMTERSYDIEVLPGTESIAGETPIWDNRKKVVFWIDFLAKKINRLDPSNNEVKSIDVNSKVGTVVLRESGGLLTALETGFNFVDFDSGKIDVITHPEPDRPNNRFNDGKCDCSGRLWISTVSQDFENGCATLEPFGSFYCFDTELKTKMVIDKVIQLNGIAWSNDNKKMYVVDTCAFEVLQFDFDEDNGRISNRKTAIKIPEQFSYPDGMCIDMENKLWVCHWGGYMISRWDPLSGKIIEKIPVPAPNVTCCAFGGNNMDELYITTAGFGTSAEELKKYPDAGRMFRLYPLVNGPEPFRFRG